MIENIRLIRFSGILRERELHLLNALLISLICKESNAHLVKYLRVRVIVLKGKVEVVNSVLVELHVEIALGPVPQEVHFLCLFNRGIEVINGVIEFAQVVVAAAKTIIDCRARLLSQAIRPVKVIDSFTNQARLKLTHTKVEEWDGVIWVDLDGRFKVFDGMLVVAHVLIDETTLNIIG